MDKTNGVPPPSSTTPHDNTTDPSGVKRKRSEPQSQSPVTQRSSINALEDLPSTKAINIVHQDILQVFKQHDTSPSVLDQPLPDSSHQDAHAPKRVKLTEDGDHNNKHVNHDHDQDHKSSSTISTRIQQGLYSSLLDIHKDVLDACAAIVDPIKSRERKNGVRLPPDDIKTMQRVMDFQHMASTLIAREKRKEKGPAINGYVQAQELAICSFKSEAVSDGKTLATTQPKTVLTLFGNAPTPRQLFSSFQHAAQSTSAVKLQGSDLSLEELGLPNMLNATKVMPLDSTAALGSRTKDATFADVFPAPATLAPLNPPKPKGTNRSASISWLGGDALLPKPSRKNIYTMQPLIVGSWLEYGGRDADKESPNAIKRRRRESVVSVAPPQKAIEDMNLTEILAQEHALFKTAYSSFAPSLDNSKAIVPEEIRDRVWWHKLGQRRFDKHFVLDPALDDSFPPALDSDAAVADDDHVTLGGTDELLEMQRTVDNFDQDSYDPEMLVSTLSNDHRSVEDILTDISDLLETLSSYQRIRNSYLAPNPSRNPTSPSPLLAASLGTATEPTKEEVATYKTLRARLAHMISTVPPYAVAKLDGEQLEDLAVSKTIIIEGKEVKGTMEEDQLTRMIRSSQAMQAAAGPASAARPTTSTSASYVRSSSSAQPPRSAHAPNPSYYAAARTPSTGFNRSTVTQNYATPSATVPRSSYARAPSYSSANTTSRPPPQPSYNQVSGQSNGQSNGQQGYRPTYNYNNTFSAQPTPQPPVQTPGGFNNNAQQTQQTQYRNSTAYNQNAVATPSYNNQQATQSRPSYTPDPSTSQFVQQRPNGQQSMSNNQQQPTNPIRAVPGYGTNPQTPSALGPSGFHTSMTSEQQQMMVERQRAQLAQQPLARMQAQADVQSRGSTTPQPPPPQQQQQQQQGNAPGGTPMVA